MKTTACLLLAALAAAPLAATEIPFSTIDVETGFVDPRSAVVADIDGDGDLDLVASSSTDGVVAFFENTSGENTSGDGQSWTRHDLATDVTGAREVTVADVDGDGDLDVIGTSFSGDEVLWWENDLDTGTACGPDFCEHLVSSSSNGAVAVVAADLDRDGDLDLAVANRASDRVDWHENVLGDASSWAAAEVGSGIDGAQVLAAGDVDGDGDLDLLVGAGKNDGLFAWYENGLVTAGECATAWCAHQLDLGPTGGVGLGDLDGDGDLDLLRAENAVGTAWWENTVGDGSSFIERSITTNVGFTSKLSAADLDGDGDLDVVAGEELPLWIENTAGDASAWIERSLPSVFERPLLTAVDLDGDGDPDLAGVSFTRDRVLWAQSETLHRSALTGEGLLVSSAFDGRSLAAADLDDDGDLDLVVGDTVGEGDPVEGTVSWLENGGDGKTWSEHLVGSGVELTASEAAVGDVDGDGDLDLFGFFDNEKQAYWFQNDGTPTDGGWNRRRLANLADQPTEVALADLDRDGDLDVIAALEPSGDVIWLINDGTPDDGNWSSRTLDSVASSAEEIAAGDIDGDGYIDVVFADSVDDELVWLENDGTPQDGGWTRHSAASELGGAGAVRLCDVDGDGELDLAATAFLVDQVLWLENDGTPASGTWTQHTVVSGVDGASDVDCLDMDADGDLDLLAAAGEGDHVSLFLSDGTPTGGGWQQQDVGNVGGPRTSLAADLDGDGRLDVVAASSDADRIDWWRNVGGQFALPTADAVDDVRPLEGDTSLPLLRIDGEHRGRAGDDDVEIATLELLFEEAAGEPLSGAELDALVSTLRLFLDNGDEVFDPATDPAIFSRSSPFELAAGVLSLVLAESDPGALQLTFGTGKTYFLTADLAAGAGTAEPDVLRVTHLMSTLNAATSTAVMVGTGIPLLLEGRDDVSSSILEVNAPPVLLNPIGDQVATEGALFMLELEPSFSEPEAEALLFEAAGLPGSLTLSSGGLLEGTPSTLDVAGSPYAITVTASDPYGASESDSFTLTLQNDPEAIFVDGFESGNTTGWSTTLGKE